MELSLLENLADPQRRGLALDQMIPGSEEHFFYSCLHLQLQTKLDEVDKLLEAWRARHGNSQRLEQIENRQALLGFERDPEAACALLRQRLRPELQHERSLGQRPSPLPTRLDPKALGIEAKRAELLAASKDLDAFSNEGLDGLLEAGLAKRLDASRRSELLRRVRLPDHPQLAELVVADLQRKKSPGFGALPIHRSLLLEQLRFCRKRLPRLQEDREFQHCLLRRLVPAGDTPRMRKPAAQRALLEAFWQEAQSLPRAYNSLKAHLLFHLLASHRAAGNYPRELFRKYLQLPRTSAFATKHLRKQPDSIDLSEDFERLTGLPEVGDDNDLVSDFLQHFLRAAEDTQEFSDCVRSDWLRGLFAASKLLHGVGDPARWTVVWDDPEAIQALRDRVELKLLPQNKPDYAPDEPVVLWLALKNVKTLLIKVFEINVRNFALQEGRAVDAELDLDGLEARHERSLALEQPPMRLVEQRIELPELAAPGVYVVECIGGGRSSRALIRKGSLRFSERPGPEGHVFCIYDEAGRALPEARLWLAGRELRAGPDATIVVPYSNAPGRRQILLCHEGLTCLEHFQHRGEDYKLVASLHVEREQLLRGETAQVLVRPQLLLNDRPVRCSVLEEARLGVTTVDQHDVEARRPIDLELHNDRETVCTLRVPEGLRRLQLRLSAKVRSLLTGDLLELAVERSFELNAIDAGERVASVLLSRDQEGFSLYVLGRAGEPRPAIALQLELHHRELREPLEAALQTDAQGRAQLGPLPGIEQLDVRGSGLWGSWRLEAGMSVWPDKLQLAADETFSLPWSGGPATPGRRELALLELRGGEYAADCFAALQLEQGRLQGALPAGCFRLIDKRSREQVEIEVSAARAEQGWLLSEGRCREHSRARQLACTELAHDASHLRLRLADASPHCRVHLLGSRFLPECSALVMEAPGWRPASFASGWPESLYISGREIGDDYRYVLERRYAARLPGNLLERPSLLLRPWELQETETSRQDFAVGGSFGAARSAPKCAAERRSRSKKKAKAQQEQGPNLDFLARSAVLLANLRPDSEGRLEVPLEQLADARQVQVLVLDGSSSLFRHHGLKEQPLERRTLTLQNALDPDAHFCERRGIDARMPGQELQFAELETAQLEVYSDFAQVFRLYGTLAGGRGLERFRFLCRWHQLSHEDKCKHLSDFGCHELHLFVWLKDRPFFEQVVRPHLQHKLFRSFVDDFLLGADLGRYLEPWAYRRLNLVERALLAAQHPSVARQVEELCGLTSADPERDARIFDTALRGSALDTDDRLGLEKLREEAERERFDGPEEVCASIADEEEDDSFADDMKADEGGFDARARGGGGQRPFYQELGATKEWAETHYYDLPLSRTDAGLLPGRPFWSDFARHVVDNGLEQPFLSQHFAQPTGSLNEQLLALALLGLPLQAEAPAIQREAAGLRLKAAAPMLAVHRQIQPVQLSSETSPVLVSQRYFRSDARTRREGGETVEMPVTGSLLCHVPYICQVVLTNTGSARLKLELLLQIPQGALPLAKGLATRGRSLQLEGFATETLEYAFYFPEPGTATHFPVHVARRGVLLGCAEPRRLQVVGSLELGAGGSWPQVSQQASLDALLSYLDGAELPRLELVKIAWRMRDAEAFARILARLSARHCYDDTLWAYSLLHKDPLRLREYLACQNGLLRNCGLALEGGLLELEPQRRGWFEHLEYAPLVNALAHPLQGKRQIANARFESQYRALLQLLSYRAEPRPAERLMQTWALLLQDRVEEARACLAQLDTARLPCAMQLAYLRSYLAFFTEQPEDARQDAAPWLDYPVPRWRALFQAVHDQLAEAQGAAPGVEPGSGREQQQGALAASEPSFELEVESGEVCVRSQNLSSCEVNYYPMDLELLFSRQPFVQELSGQFAYIRPKHSEQRDLDPQGGALRFPLPERFAASNLVVEVVAAGKRQTRATTAHQLRVAVSESYGRLQVRHLQTGKPLPAVYVKVYAREQHGSVRMHKDGYTDLRGIFDYVSVSAPARSVERFALLVLSEEHGALVREAPPPQR